MNMNNTQLGTIQRHYDSLQTAAHREYEQRLSRIYAAIPEYKDIDDSIRDLCSSFIKRKLAGSTESKDELKKETGRLEAEKKRLLSDAGYPDDYLENIYSCPDCKDTGFIGNKRCHCYSKFLTNIMSSSNTIFTNFNNASFDDFDIEYYSESVDRRTGISPRDSMRNILSICKKFLDGTLERKNILFYGSTGVGKSFISSCIASEAAARGLSVSYIGAIKLMELFIDHANRDSDSLERENINFSYRQIFDCDLLIIDDLGTESISPFKDSQLLSCIDERLRKNRSTIISTNLSLKDIQNRYSERISSRVLSSYEICAVLGEDIRLKRSILKP